MEEAAEAQEEQEIAVIPRINEENKPFEALLEDFIKFVVGKFSQPMSGANASVQCNFYNIVVDRGRGIGGQYYLTILNEYSNPNSYDTYSANSIDLIVYYMKKMKIRNDVNAIDYIEFEKDADTSGVTFVERNNDSADITRIVSKYFNKSEFIFAYLCYVCDVYDSFEVTFKFASASVIMIIGEQIVYVALHVYSRKNLIEFNYKSKYSSELLEQINLDTNESGQQTNEKIKRLLKNETFMLYIEEMIALDIFKNVRKTLHVRPAVAYKE